MSPYSFPEGLGLLQQGSVKYGIDRYGYLDELCSMCLMLGVEEKADF